MKMTINQEKENPLFDRTEMEVEIKNEQTPSRAELIKQLSAETGKDQNRISIQKIEQKYGKKESLAFVRIYTSEDARKKFEKEHILKRSKKEAVNEKEAPDKNKE